jgi:hypothetical protein
MYVCVCVDVLEKSEEIDQEVHNTFVHTLSIVLRKEERASWLLTICRNNKKRLGGN